MKTKITFFTILFALFSLFFFSEETITANEPLNKNSVTHSSTYSTSTNNIKKELWLKPINTDHLYEEALDGYVNIAVYAHMGLKIIVTCETGDLKGVQFEIDLDGNLIEYKLTPNSQQLLDGQLYDVYDYNNFSIYYQEKNQLMLCP